MLDNNFVVYDIEVLPNVFSCVIMDSNRKPKLYEISPRRNDIEKFVARLRELDLNSTVMVGFNNVGYDYPVIHYVVTKLYSNGYTSARELTRLTKAYSDKIIKAVTPAEKFKFNIWENKMLVKQVDLYKMHHFDNKAKSTSLKRLQFNMRLKSIEEFELDFDKPIKKAKDIDTLNQYCLHDVQSTYEFLLASESAVAFREELSTPEKSYYNYNDTKIGEDYFVTRLAERVGEDTLYEYTPTGRKKRGTPRDIVKISDIIFPHIQFVNPEFQEILERMKSMYMFVIKGKFHWNEDINYPKHYERLKEWQSDLTRRRKSMDKEDYKAEKANLDHEKSIWCDHALNCEHGGISFEFGKGGLHASVNNTLVEADDEYMIWDWDVTSFYPSIGIAYGLYPEHLGEEFSKIYEELKIERVSYSKKTHPVQNKMLKLALNGTYGKTNSKYSVFFDPQYTMQTTLNGQLMLAMLWDRLSFIPDCQIIQANTDGITIKVKKADREKVVKVCRHWEKYTRMALEEVEYSRMWVRDGNNYIAEYIGGGLKSKGDYVYKSLYHSKGMEADGVEWHKNHSALVINKAVEAYLVDGVPIEKFIENHNDIYDFFLITNVKGKSSVMWGEGKEGENQKLQKNTRYIISNSGKSLNKVMPPLKNKTDWRWISINKDWLTTPYNVVTSTDIDDYDINYDFYIEEAKKLAEVF